MMRNELNICINLYFGILNVVFKVKFRENHLFGNIWLFSPRIVFAFVINVVDYKILYKFCLKYFFIRFSVFEIMHEESKRAVIHQSRIPVNIRVS